MRNFDTGEMVVYSIGALLAGVVLYLYVLVFQMAGLMVSNIPDTIRLAFAATGTFVKAILIIVAYIGLPFYVWWQRNKR